MILEYGLAVAVAAARPARPAGQTASAVLHVSVTVVSSCAITTLPRANVRCGAGVPQPIQRFDSAASRLTIDF